MNEGNNIKYKSRKDKKTTPEDHLACVRRKMKILDILLLPTTIYFWEGRKV